MAIAFGRMEFVKRSSEKNMVAKASYNGKIQLKFDGNCVISPRLYDWSKGKDKPLYHEIMLPDGADKKFKDTELLWNSVERSEKRKDAQVGKEILLALPDDKIISNEQRIELATKFAQKYVVSKGYAVQVDVHYPSQQKTYSEDHEESEINLKNFHAHLLISSRSFNEEGSGFNLKKSNELVPDIRGKEHFAIGGIEWSKIWTQFQNEFFEENGLDLRVDQTGIVPQSHLGPLRMRGKKSHELLELQSNQIELDQFMSQDPHTILQKLTENKSIFTETDLELFLQKNVLPNEVEKVRGEFWKCKDIVQLYEQGTKKATNTYTSSEVLDEEQKIIRISDSRNKQQAIKSNNFKLSVSLNEEQKNAFNEIISGSSLSCIEGFAGTGKSYLLVALKEHYEKNGIRVRAFGPDNATVKVLREKGFSDSSNVYQFLFKNHFSKKKPIHRDREVWIVDEASKLGNKPLLELLKAAEKLDVQLIFSGNSAQLSSVERGEMFSYFCKKYGHSLLCDIQRQKFTIDRDISKRLAFGDIANAVGMIANKGGFVWAKDKDEKLLLLIENWAKDTIDFPFSSKMIIANSNDEVRILNDLAHAIRQKNSEISAKEYICKTPRGNILVSEGDIIEFRSNHKDLELKNGQIGTLIKASEKKFIVMTEGKEVSFNPEIFTNFQLGYATTYYRSQGRTVDRCYISYTPQMHQKLLYVGKTRHIHQVKCYVSRTEASCLMDLKKQVSRNKAIENTMNFTSYAEIDRENRNKQRENRLNNLCSSDQLLSRLQGFSLKAWDSFKSSTSLLLQEIKDVRPNENFFRVAVTENQFKGSVKEIIPSKETLPFEKSFSVKKPSFLSKNSFASLPNEKKIIYRNYFELSEKASSLYTILQSECTASSMPKDHAQSYAAWQKACGERNEAAFHVMRMGGHQKAILGSKGYEILQDRALRHEKVIEPRISIQSQLEDNIERLLHQLFPEGPQRKNSRGFRFGSKGSVSVECVGANRGAFYDHENKEGGNLLQLIQKKKSLDFTQAIEWAKNFLKEEGSHQFIPSQFSTRSLKIKEESNWISLMPPENPSIPSLSSLSKYLNDNYSITGKHPYYNSDGKLVCYTIRLETPRGDKIILPVSYGKIDSESEPKWALKRYFSHKELIYNEHLLNQNPSKTILIVEGEKTADAALKLLGNEYTVISWLGGAGGAKNADWSKIFNRDVIIWPDNDSAGFKAADDICKCLRGIGLKSLKVVAQESLKDCPLKWDLADPLPDGKSANFIEDTLLRSEEKGINIDRIQLMADQYRLSFKQANEIVVGVDNSMRNELGKKYQTQPWMINAEILRESNKIMESKAAPTTQSSTLSLKEIEKNRNQNLSLER